MPRRSTRIVAQRRRSYVRTSPLYSASAAKAAADKAAHQLLLLSPLEPAHISAWTQLVSTKHGVTRIELLNLSFWHGAKKSTPPSITPLLLTTRLAISPPQGASTTTTTNPHSLAWSASSSIRITHPVFLSILAHTYCLLDELLLCLFATERKLGFYSSLSLPACFKLAFMRFGNTRSWRIPRGGQIRTTALVAISFFAFSFLGLSRWPDLLETMACRSPFLLFPLLLPSWVVHTFFSTPCWLSCAYGGTRLEIVGRGGWTHWERQLYIRRIVRFSSLARRQTKALTYPLDTFEHPCFPIASFLASMAFPRFHDLGCDSGGVCCFGHPASARARSASALPYRVGRVMHTVLCSIDLLLGTYSSPPPSARDKKPRSLCCMDNVPPEPPPTTRQPPSPSP